MTPISSPVYSVITATYNEAENIQDFLRTVAGVLRGPQVAFEILVVDDNSPDGTGKLTRELSKELVEVRLITRQGERGIGSAYLRGITEAKGEFVALLDADFSHPPALLPDLFSLAQAGSLAIGSRFLKKGDFRTLWYRVAPTRVINSWHAFLLRSRVRDHSNGFLAIRRSALLQLLAAGERIGIRPFERTLYQLALIVLARRSGVPIKEVAAPYEFRERGQTKIGIRAGVALLFQEWLDSLRIARYARSAPPYQAAGTS
jgi:dolichol-phosphate mannosyltransferase